MPAVEDHPDHTTTARCCSFGYRRNAKVPETKLPNYLDFILSSYLLSDHVDFASNIKAIHKIHSKSRTGELMHLRPLCSNHLPIAVSAYSPFFPLAMSERDDFAFCAGSVWLGLFAADLFFQHSTRSTHIRNLSWTGNSPQHPL